MLYYYENPKPFLKNWFRRQPALKASSVIRSQKNTTLQQGHISQPQSDISCCGMVGPVFSSLASLSTNVQGLALIE